MDAREMKIKAAAAALDYVEDGMRLGIGTGSTAEEFVRLLAEKVASGFPGRGRTHIGADRSALPGTGRTAEIARGPSRT